MLGTTLGSKRAIKPRRFFDEPSSKHCDPGSIQVGLGYHEIVGESRNRGFRADGNKRAVRDQALDKGPREKTRAMAGQDRGTQ
jgi:hypothetical protein